MVVYFEYFEELLDPESKGRPFCGTFRVNRGLACGERLGLPRP